MEKRILLLSIAIVVIALIMGAGIVLNKKNDVSVVRLTESDFYSDDEEKKERYQNYVERTLSEYICELADREEVNIDVTVYNDTDVEEVIIHQDGLAFTDDNATTIEKAVKVFVGNNEVKITFKD